MTKEELRQGVEKAIEEHGIEKVMKRFQSTISLMKELVGKSQLTRSMGEKAQFMINVGLENVRPLVVETYVECALEMMEDGPKKDYVKEILEYWHAHRQDILDDNRIVEGIIA